MSYVYKALKFFKPIKKIQYTLHNYKKISAAYTPYIYVYFYKSQLKKVHEWIGKYSSLQVYFVQFTSPLTNITNLGLLI